MDGTKAWYLSNGAWANLLSFVVSVGTMLHVWNASQGASIVQYGPAVGVTVAMAALAVWGFIGRLRATKILTF